MDKKEIKELIIDNLSKDEINELFVSIYEDDRNKDKELLSILTMETTQSTMFTIVVHGIVNMIDKHDLEYQLISDNIFHQISMAYIEN